MGPRTGLTGAENLALTGIRSPDLPGRSESLYRLRCPGPFINKVWKIIRQDVSFQLGGLNSGGVIHYRKKPTTLGNVTKTSKSE